MATTTHTDFDMVPGESVTVTLNADGTFDVARVTPTPGTGTGITRVGPWLHIGDTFHIGVCDMTTVADLVAAGTATMVTTTT